MTLFILICVAVACGASAQSDARDSRTIHTAQGPVRGYKNDEIFEFYGIPYATAPTGPNRYKVSSFRLYCCFYLALNKIIIIYFRPHFPAQFGCTHLKQPTRKLSVPKLIYHCLVLLRFPCRKTV